MILNREQIIAKDDIETIEVEVPEWGGAVLVKSLTGEERDQYESSLFTGQGEDRKENLINLRAKLVAVSLVDENGERLFSIKDAKELGKKSAAALNRVFRAAQEMSGLGAAAENEYLEDLDEGQS